MKKLIITYYFLMLFNFGVSQSLDLDFLAGVSIGINNFSYIDGENSKFHQIPTAGILWGLRGTLNRPSKKSFFEFLIMNFGNSIGAEVRNGGHISSMVNGNADVSYSVGMGYRKMKRKMRSIVVSAGFGFENIKLRNVNLRRIGQIEFYKATTEEKLNPFVYLTTGYCYCNGRHLFKFQMIGRVGWHVAKQEWFRAYGISTSPISAIIKNKGDLVSFSLSYGYRLFNPSNKNK